MADHIRLFWWSRPFIHKASKENYGDLLGKYLAERISGKQVRFARPDRFSLSNLWSPIYVTIGSILEMANSQCIVWGSGIIRKDQKVKKTRFLSVRGPLTRERLLAQGHEVPEVYGDPALLLPRYYHPIVDQVYELGIIPHYNDHATVSAALAGRKDIKVIDMLSNDVEATTQEILSCKTILSSSLHGIIMAHAYGIPVAWVRFSDKLAGDDIKFHDHFASVGLKVEGPLLCDDVAQFVADADRYKAHLTLPDAGLVNRLCDGLMAVCPFVS